MERERNMRGFRVRSSHFSLGFPMIDPYNSGETRGNVDPTARASRGCRKCGVSTNPGGRVSPILLFLV